jgi:hypothetical protein
MASSPAERDEFLEYFSPSDAGAIARPVLYRTEQHLHGRLVIVDFEKIRIRRAIEAG